MILALPAGVSGEPRQRGIIGERLSGGRVCFQHYLYRSCPANDFYRINVSAVRSFVGCRPLASNADGRGSYPASFASDIDRPGRAGGKSRVHVHPAARCLRPQDEGCAIGVCGIAEIEDPLPTSGSKLILAHPPTGRPDELRFDII